MDNLLKIILSLLNPVNLGAMLRWLLGLAGGWLLAQGWLTSDQVTEVVTAAVAALLPIIWSLLQKYRQQQLVKVALSLPAGATQEQAQLALKLSSKHNA